MYAIIECGGKQYRVQEGDLVRVEKLAVEVGSNYTTDKVLMVGGDNNTMIGTPYVPGYVVSGKVLNHDKEKKVLVFRYKAKKNIRVRYGHRQPFTSLLIEQIKKGKVEPVEIKTEKAPAKTVKVEAETEKKETKAKAAVKAAPAEAEVKTVKTAKATSTTKAKATTGEAAAKTVKTAKPKADSTEAASAAKPAAAKAVKTAEAETAATKTTKAKTAKTEKTEA